MLSTALALSGLLACFLLIECSVFLDPRDAVQLLRSSSRRRRANSFSLEELLPGDLERECYEELCSQEEAAEIFQSQETTMEFWYRYKNLNPCSTNPCLNGGICTVGRGGFTCLCPPTYQGKICDSAVSECRYKNGGCLQYCRNLEGGTGVQCGCADGFRLETDGKSCTPTVEFPCGRQQGPMAYYSRSLFDSSEDVNVTMEMDRILVGNSSTVGEVSDKNTTETLKEFLTAHPTSSSTGVKEEPEGAELSPRIVGGNLERAGGSPWQVLIHRSDGFGFCGGTLILDQWVISAAHCFEQSADHVTIGDYDRNRPDPAILPSSTWPSQSSGASRPSPPACQMLTCLNTY